VKESENGRPVQFLKRADHWCTFSWSICDEICHIIKSIERNRWQKTTLTERERILRKAVSKKITEMNIHLEHPVSTKIV
jgi:hypothetical protein